VEVEAYGGAAERRLVRQGAEVATSVGPHSRSAASEHCSLARPPLGAQSP
jgi:hypothetical protein